MDAFTITGGYPLAGTIRIHGGKNAALPQLAATLLTDEPLVLHDIPRLDDIRNMCRLLNELGVRISGDLESPDAPPGPYRTVALQTIDETQSHARYDIVRTMRASICVLGPMLARRGEARVSLPGGCAIGDRPIDIHLRGLRSLGAEIRLEQGDVIARAPGGRLIGGTVFLGGPFGSTVLGTANVLCAATLAEGRTVIECAACEPEIADLGNLLNAMGARVTGAGTPRITVEGVDRLHSTTHTIMPDRIEAGTFMIAAAITRGDVTLENCPLDSLLAFTDALNNAGVSIDVIDETDPMRAICRVRREGDLLPVHVTTQPHPGFPTDLQAQLMSMLTLARGNSVITERIFPNRFLHVAELSRMGADIHREGPSAVIHGVRELIGAPVMASDLRASACLVLAALAARGTTTIDRVYHIDRGYEQIERMIQALGGEIQRVEVVTKSQTAQPAGERMAG
ncbi:MAG: UDP-N-acetylglucosamine 1-carboxyvinyltransferase [Planctomycetota bacterium]|jgi:UDP-N-acetylglucosamine 1-carboxyvinyltransferase